MLCYHNFGSAMKLLFSLVVVVSLVTVPTTLSAQSKAARHPVPEPWGHGAVPQYALDVYNHIIDFGRAPNGYVGGAVWHNRERRLPEGRYREYDVHPKKKGVNRGPERIVIDVNTNRGWYSADHYRTFMPIPPIHLKPNQEAQPRDHLH
jgi:ribonuclease T1